MNILLGVSGGIAAYKSVLLLRLLVEAGHDVHVVPTESALEFVGAVTWEAISGHPVTHEVHDGAAGVLHVRLGQEADVIVIAPATANTIARLAAGIADDLLGTTLLATRAPVVIAPAMHTEMWEHPATQRNVQLLRERGATIVGPDSGRLTGADSGPGRMSEPERIFEETLRVARETAGGRAGERAVAHGGVGSDVGAAGNLSGLRFAISAGGTREPIDPVRFIGNRSSGRQGVALARAAAERGATVELIAANVEQSVLAEVKDRPSVRVVPVTTAAELQEAMETASAGADVVVMAAAVADFRPRSIEESKIRKADLNGAVPTIELVENPDVLAGLVQRREPGQVIVGFAAETAEDEDRLLELGREKLRRKGVDLLVVNPVGWTSGFESDGNSIRVLDRSGTIVGRAEGSKRETAEAVLDALGR